MMKSIPEVHPENSQSLRPFCCLFLFLQRPEENSDYTKNYKKVFQSLCAYPRHAVIIFSYREVEVSAPLPSWVCKGFSSPSLLASCPRSSAVLSFLTHHTQTQFAESCTRRFKRTITLFISKSMPQCAVYVVPFLFCCLSAVYSHTNNRQRVSLYYAKSIITFGNRQNKKAQMIRTTSKYTRHVTLIIRWRHSGQKTNLWAASEATQGA